MKEKLLLPVGFKFENFFVTEFDVAETGGEAEKIYTEVPSDTNLYTWFAKVIAISVSNIAGMPIASNIINDISLGKEISIPDVIYKIPLVDVGSLLLQIQRICWQDVIQDQKILCNFCGKELVADIDLKKIAVPVNAGEIIEEQVIRLDKTYTISTGIEQLLDYEGKQFNNITVRVPVLSDAIRHQNISSDDLMFWRKIAFDCQKNLFFQETESSERQYVPEGYIGRRGMLFFSKDLHSKTLKIIRNKLQSGLPSAKFYYEGECPCPRKKQIRYFTDVSNFFSF
jgi:hypothetical protein